MDRAYEVAWSLMAPHILTVTLASGRVPMRKMADPPLDWDGTRKTTGRWRASEVRHPRTFGSGPTAHKQYQGARHLLNPDRWPFRVKIHIAGNGRLPT